MTNRNLHLIGTVHIDPRGLVRLDAVLEHLHPDQIALEMAKNREDIPQRVRDVLPAIVGSLNFDSDERKEVIRKFGEYIADELVGYERKSCARYTRQNPSTRLDYIDLSIVDPSDYVNFIVSNFRSFLPILEQGSDEEALKRNLSMASEVAYFAYEIGALKTETSEEQTKGMSDKDIQILRKIHSPVRDDAMSGNIRRLYSEQKGLVAVVGLFHLDGLQRRLQDLSPTVLSLAKAAETYQ